MPTPKTRNEAKHEEIIRELVECLKMLHFNYVEGIGIPKDEIYTRASKAIANAERGD